MNESVNIHNPVLLEEVIHHLNIKKDGIYLDATFGRGGHSQAILNQLGPSGRLFAIDKDPEAIAYADELFSQDKRFTLFHGSFANLADFLKDQNVFGKISGILLDLGVSSPQLDNSERGFSFLREGKLDMRMDSSKGIDAMSWLASVSEEELADVLWQFGEERFSRRIARAIVTSRAITPITTTSRLAAIVAAANPAWEKGKNPATRAFQAIRIYINNELEDLKEGLKQSVDALEKGGRLLVISFHSLEDRLVKHFIQDEERGQSFPAGLPIKHVDIQSRMKRVEKAIKPSPKEIAFNPRARSAVLRIAEKLL